MRSLGRLFRLGIFNGNFGIESPYLSNQDEPPSDLDLYECPRCGGLRRIPTSGSFCKGTRSQRHPPTVMKVIPDDNQEETPDLLIDDEE